MSESKEMHYIIFPKESCISSSFFLLSISLPDRTELSNRNLSHKSKPNYLNFLVTYKNRKETGKLTLIVYFN